jgi:hypothetical protein
VATDADAATPATSAPSASPISPLAAGAWQTYRNERAGYRVEHPADWTVSEQANADGSMVTTFSAAGGGPSIVVSSALGQILSDNDLPNTRCEQVTIGGLPGTRCFDTINRSTSITLVGEWLFGRGSGRCRCGRRLHHAGAGDDHCQQECDDQ